MQALEILLMENNFSVAFHVKQIFKLVVTLCCFLGVTFSSTVTEAGVISEKQEIEMGKVAAEQIEAHYGVLNDPMVTDRVERIGQSLVAVCGRKNLTYTLRC